MAKTKIIFTLALWLLATPAFAKTKLDCSGTPHTVHLLSTNKNATCVLSRLYEPEDFCLVGASGNDISGTSFAVSPGAEVKFGMIFDGDADFNMEYALTCVLSGSDTRSPKVIFMIGADGPADPDISVINLYGAKGSWQATGLGENYTLIF
jgi:hypothetical protein